MKITIGNIIFVILFVLIFGIIVLALIPQTSNKIDYIIKAGVNSLPIPITYEQKGIIAGSIINTFAYVDVKMDELPKVVTQEVVKYVPPNIVRQVTKGIPNTMIDPDKCKRIIVDDKFIDENKGEKIPLPESMPWDDEIDYCKLRLGTIDDINLDSHIVNNGPKIILY